MVMAAQIGDLSSGTEFIAPDVLSKTANAGAPKKTREFI